MGSDYKVYIKPLGKEVTGRNGQSVLAVLQRHFYGRDGRSAFYGCRRGGCGTCKMKLMRGEVDHDRVYSRAALTDEERLSGYILACRSYLRTDITICMVKSSRRLNWAQKHGADVLDNRRNSIR